MKKPAENAKEAEEERRLQLCGSSCTADFHDLVDHTHESYYILLLEVIIVCCAFNWIAHSVFVFTELSKLTPH
jgi:hypothetical protein